MQKNHKRYFIDRFPFMFEEKERKKKCVVKKLGMQ